jgi:hypothetical protein
MPPYQARPKDDRFEVVDEANGTVITTRATLEAAEDYIDRRELRDEFRKLGDRIPNKELTPEEKAAAYDKMIAEQAKEKNQPPPTNNDGGNTDNSGAPPPPKPKEQEPPKETGKKRAGFWSAYE